MQSHHVNADYKTTVYMYIDVVKYMCVQQYTRYDVTFHETL